MLGHFFARNINFNPRMTFFKSSNNLLQMRLLCLNISNMLCKLDRDLSGPSAVVELCAVSAPSVVPSAFPHPAIVNSIAAAQVSAIIFLQYFFIIIVPSLFLYMNII